jgi:hypothetical protein
VVASLVASGPARADDRDYGEQIALADVASLGVLVAATRVAARRDTDRAYTIAIAVGLGSYAVVAPAVHLIGHRQADRAAASLAMRLVPVASFASIGRCGGGEAAVGCVVGRVLLAVVGAVAASAIDVFVVADGPAHEPVPVIAAMAGRF